MPDVVDSLSPLAEPNDQSLRIGFNLVHDLVQIQIGQSDALDAKANFVLGSATVLIGTYGAFIAAWGGAPTNPITVFLLVNAPLVLSFFATIGFGFMGYMVRKFTTAPNPQKFVALMLHLDERQTRLTLLKALAVAYETNSGQLARKAAYVSVALAFLGIEAVVLIATLGILALG